MKRFVPVLAVVALAGGVAAQAAQAPGGASAEGTEGGLPAAKTQTPQQIRKARIEAKRKARWKRRKALRRRVVKAGVDPRWNGPLSTYTGGSYGIGVVNQMYATWPRGPQISARREIMIREAADHRIPYRLLVGVYGIESGFGAYACSFGLTGFYSSGTSGSFAVDAHIAARLLAQLWRGSYGGSAVR